MAAGFLEVGNEALVMSMDNSADLFQAVVSESAAESVLFGWAEGEGPVFPPREGAFVRLIDSARPGRALAHDAQVVERGGNRLRCKLIGQPEPYERRSYKRVDAVLPLRFSLQRADSGPTDLMQRMDRLEEVVAQIAKHLGIKNAAGERSVGLREVFELSLSGGGVGLLLEHHVGVGERIDLDLELPLHPPIQIRTGIEVVRCDPGLSADGTPSWVAGGRFQGLASDDRAAIVRYSAQRERELARSGTPAPR